MNDFAGTNWRVGAGGAEAPHPPREQLLLYLDGELSDEEGGQIKGHLEACWKCRAHLSEIEATITAFSRFDDAVLTECLPPPPGGWRGFEGKLRQLAVENGEPSVRQRWRGWWARALEGLHQPHRQTRWAMVLMLLVCLGAIAYWMPRRASVSASELLQRSIEAESAEWREVAQPVVYRKLRVRRQAMGVTESVAWESWREIEGERFRRQAAGGSSLLAAFDEVMRVNRLDGRQPLSAIAFAAWRQGIRPEAETVTETGEGLMLTTRVASPFAVNAIREASLLVRTGDWRVMALRLQVHSTTGIHDYELTETDHEVLPLQGLTVFADPALETPAAAEATPAPTPGPTMAETMPAAPAERASAEDEVAVMELLNGVNALLGEQIGVARTVEGKLRVEGVVETDVRKSEILQALQLVADRPAVEVEIVTVAEAQARQSRGEEAGARRIVIDDPLVAQPTIPVETELRGYLAASSKLTGERLEQEIQRFAVRICQRSSRARAHALALKQIAERLTPGQLPDLDRSTRQRWQSLLGQHAQAYRREMQELRQTIGPIFPVAAETVAADGTPPGDEEMLRAIDRLFTLAADHDSAICLSFSASTEKVTAPAVKRAEFWRAVGAAENLAALIARWQ